MQQLIISEAKAKRLERHAEIKKEYGELMGAGSDSTAVVDHLAQKYKASISTIYRIIKK